MYRRDVVFLTLAVVALTVDAGCDKGANIGLAPVSGKVTMDGAPMAKATVTFSPTDAGANAVPSIGTTDTQGSFTLRASTGEMGAMPGMHNVTIINATDLAPGEPLPDDRSLWKKPEKPIPEKYNNPQKPVITFSVPPTGSDSANFDLKSK